MAYVQIFLGYLLQNCLLLEVQTFDPRIRYDEPLRPQFHYTTSLGWLSDPNGLFTYQKTHHLMYQHLPNDEIKGFQMHMGHAISEDWLHWREQEPVVYPSVWGVVFTGSGMVDERNVSGLQTSDAHKAVILMYTRRLTIRSGIGFYEQQFISHSNDGCKTWIHKRDPVIKQPLRIVRVDFSFRDPKLLVVNGKYFAAISTTREVLFYESRNLIKWTLVSKFGQGYGAHDGELEGPDLTQLDFEGRKYWILFANLTPHRRRYNGTPNGGSGPQYFIGDFKNRAFSTNENITRWLDYGPDCFAGWLWFGTNRFVCWLGNWYYATSRPTFPWRGQMSMFRDIRLVRGKGDLLYVASTPIDLSSLRKSDKSAHSDNIRDLNIAGGERAAYGNLTDNLWEIYLLFDITGLQQNDQIRFCAANDYYDEICVHYFMENETYMINRWSAGNVGFDPNFRHFLYPQAPRLTTSIVSNWTILLDQSSIELFADDGLTTMTAVFYPFRRLTALFVELISPYSNSSLELKSANFYALNSIWH